MWYTSKEWCFEVFSRGFSQSPCKHLTTTIVHSVSFLESEDFYKERRITASVTFSDVPAAGLFIDPF